MQQTIPMRRLFGRTHSKNGGNGNHDNHSPEMKAKFPSTITNVRAAQRLDSKGRPTVQVRVTKNKGTFTASASSGVSRGPYEAYEIIDENQELYKGNGVEKAVYHAQHVIGPELVDQCFDVRKDLAKIDQFMIKLDGTKDKGNLGANAILPLSIACARAAAAARDVPLYEFLRQEAHAAERLEGYLLPVPFFNMLNGGAHSGNQMALQEFTIAPVGAESMAQAVQIGCEVYQELKGIIKKKYGTGATNIGDDGGFSPPISDPEEALDLLTEAVRCSGHEGKVRFGIDAASSEFFESGCYDLGYKQEHSERLSFAQLTTVYNKLLQKYPVVLLEDPFAEDDWASWRNFNRDCKIELVGDDLLATNISRLAMAREHAACNSMLLKVNQIGTVSEALSAAESAYSFGWNVFVSHRSGETNDDFISDLATWEDPSVADTHTHIKGEDDPLDVCEMGGEVGYTGEVKPVKVLGAFAIIDEGETDWKVLVMDVREPLAAKVDDIGDLEPYMPGYLETMKWWFKLYKVPEGKKENEGKIFGKDFAMELVKNCHRSWETGINEKRSNPTTSSLGGLGIHGGEISSLLSQMYHEKGADPNKMAIDKSHFFPASYTYTPGTGGTTSVMEAR
ncbi:hypothetical protein NECHADRAFT_90528 [Paecilomyces variotii No. 5]|uniref:Enolase n=1 Tax=Byssochlamys spectabilis (strain No. 5 / NBRC 109023) TaxID=1356009 RepID=V5FAW6_BYSSN|nr:hypothetical protein NECHADRAFT_90528 [Paecilomyces variotii No. 5]